MKLVVALEQDLEYTRLENGMIERYLDKNDPELLLGVTNLLHKPKTPTRIHFAPTSPHSMSVGTGSVVDTMHHSSIMRSSRRTIDADTLSVNTTQSFRSTNSLGFNMHVNYLMRCEMCDMDCHNFGTEIDELRACTKEELRVVTAKVEELRLSSAEAVETLKEFKKFVLGTPPATTVVDVIKPITAAKKRTVPLERFQKFIDKWLRNGLALVEKMRLHNDYLKQRIGVAHNDLALKAELSCMLRPIDFEQMAADRHHHLHSLEIKHQHLEGLKNTAGDVSLQLSTTRKQLDNDQRLLDVVVTKIGRADKEIERLDRVRQQIVSEIRDWRSRIEAIRQRMTGAVSPSADAYMERKKLLRTLDAEVATLHRMQTIAASKLVCTRQKVVLVKKQRQLDSAKRELDSRRFAEILKGRTTENFFV